MMLQLLVTDSYNCLKEICFISSRKYVVGLHILQLFFEHCSLAISIYLKVETLELFNASTLHLFFSFHTS